MAETSLTTQVKEDETQKSETEIQSTSTSSASEDKPTSSSSGSWFSNIVNVAKQKSSKTLEFMKRDLTEFKDTVQLNTSAAINTTTSYIGETISSLNNPKDETDNPEEKDEPEADPETTSESKELIPSPVHKSNTNQKEADLINYLSNKAKSIFSSIVDVMIPHEYEDDDDICFVKGNKIVSIERGRWDLLMKTIQSDPQTYCHEPEGPPEDYENWLISFNLIDYDYKIDQLLSSEDGVVKGFYEKLVPHSITPDEFWHRYFYKVHQLKQIEFQRLAAKAEEQERQEKAEEIKAEKERIEKEIGEKESVSTTIKETIKPPGSVPSRNNSNTNLELKKSSPVNDLEIKTLTTSNITTTTSTTTTSTNTSSLIGSTIMTSSIDTLTEGNQLIGGVEGNKLTSGGVSPASDSTKQSDGSEEWVKTEMMDDIVTEAMKKLDTKLTDNPTGSKVKDDDDDDMLYDWDSS
ncbi:BSD domain-containing protein 1-like isoform X2 [Panonychus citri]|uniref:BSD domain-containing protein 1-like isoform X2 n=1 Tax=Panonychus citri TaxID=50023 RepID=UPI002307D45D|nr:BSD domain-containing protein 1-like isoform X2 [Panonychus citri]